MIDVARCEGPQMCFVISSAVLMEREATKRNKGLYNCRVAAYRHPDSIHNKS